MPNPPGSDVPPADLTVLTYNIHSCRGTDRRLDPGRIADVIAAAAPDVVSLQEVDVGRARTGGVDQAQWIADRLDMTAHFHPALHLAEERYGDAILTSLPSRLVHAGPLPSVGEARGALWVEVTVGRQKVQIFNTHFGLRSAERILQAQALVADGWIGHPVAEGAPVILMGDFNAVPSSPAYKMLSRRLSPVRPPDGGRLGATFPSRFPLLRLDHVFVSPGIDVVSAQRITTLLSKTASDHLPLKVVLRIEPPRLLEPFPSRAVPSS